MVYITYMFPNKMNLSCIINITNITFPTDPSWGKQQTHSQAVPLFELGAFSRRFLSRSEESSHATSQKKERVGKKTNQWSFLVPLIGGRLGDIESPNSQYIPLIYHLYIAYWVIIYHLPPIKGTRNSYWTKGETKGYKAGTGMSCWYLVTGWFHPYISRL